MLHRPCLAKSNPDGQEKQEIEDCACYGVVYAISISRDTRWSFFNWPNIWPDVGNRSNLPAPPFRQPLSNLLVCPNTIDAWKLALVLTCNANSPCRSKISDSDPTISSLQSECWQFQLRTCPPYGDLSVLPPLQESLEARSDSSQGALQNGNRALK